ncbi:hypothetical protein [Mailhella sp.]
MDSLEIVSEKHLPWLSEEIEWIRLGWNIDFVNEQSVDVDDLIIKTATRLLLLHYREFDDDNIDSTILIAELNSYDEKKFPLLLPSTPDEPIRFVRLCYDEGTLDTLKFAMGDRYLFIYGTGNVLIILKSYIDVVDPDGRRMPEVDDSVLFPPEVLKEYYAILDQEG